MDFEIPAQTRDMLAGMREFVEQEIYPLEPTVNEKGFGGAKAELNVLYRQKVRDRGWWCPQIDKEHGGMGLPLLEHGMVSEELGRSPLGHYAFNCQAPDAGNMEILIQYATAEQKKRFLEPLIRGDIRSCFSMTEPDRPGSNPTWMETTAMKDGDDYVINGRKWFTSSADGAAFAIVMAVTNPVPRLTRGPARFWCRPIRRASSSWRNIPIMGHAGADYDSHAEIEYENCRVPQANLLGTEGAGFLIAQERLGPGRIHHCMRWIGICERSFDLMCRVPSLARLPPTVPSVPSRSFRPGSPRAGPRSMPPD